MTQILPQYIGGERVSAAASEDSTNPSNTNDIVARAPRGGAQTPTPVRSRRRSRAVAALIATSAMALTSSGGLLPAYAAEDCRKTRERTGDTPIDLDGETVG